MAIPQGEDEAAARRIALTYASPAAREGRAPSAVQQNVPAWLVVWRGLNGATLDERFGVWPEGSLVDAVFLVDGVTGDCCWVTRFLAGDSRLG